MEDPRSYLGATLTAFLREELGGDDIALASILKETTGASQISDRETDDGHDEDDEAEAELSVSQHIMRNRKAISNQFERCGIYRGYVDDDRNTDNAWIETTVLLIIVDEANTTKMLKLAASREEQRQSKGRVKSESEFTWIGLSSR